MNTAHHLYRHRPRPRPPPVSTAIGAAIPDLPAPEVLTPFGLPDQGTPSLLRSFGAWLRTRLFGKAAAPPAPG